MGAACTAPQASDQRTWFAVPFGVVDRDEGRTDPVDDGLAAGIDGGLELNTDWVRCSWEIGANWSDHELRGDADLQVFRLSTGLRLAARARNTPVGAYLRGGVMWRSEDSDEQAAYAENDDAGYYVGGGLEWWYSDVGALGPFVTRFHGSDDDLDETWYGIAVRFYLGTER